MRWKFVEGRTVELKGNAGLALPANIGELGGSVTTIDLSDHNLGGECRRARVVLLVHDRVCTLAGELPLEVIRMKAKGAMINLSGNTPGFTLPANIGELGDDITELDLSDCSLKGAVVCLGLHARNVGHI